MIFFLNFHSFMLMFCQTCLWCGRHLQIKSFISLCVGQPKWPRRKDLPIQTRPREWIITVKSGFWISGTLDSFFQTEMFDNPKKNWDVTRRDWSWEKGPISRPHTKTQIPRQGQRSYINQGAMDGVKFSQVPRKPLMACTYQATKWHDLCPRNGQGNRESRIPPHPMQALNKKDHDPGPLLHREVERTPVTHPAATARCETISN